MFEMERTGRDRAPGVEAGLPSVSESVRKANGCLRKATDVALEIQARLLAPVPLAEETERDGDELRGRAADTARKARTLAELLGCILAEL